MEAPDGTASHTKQINETIPMSANTGAQNCMSAAWNEPSGCSIDFQLFEDRGRVKKVTKSRTIISLSLVLQTSPERRGLLEGFKTNSKVNNAPKQSSWQKLLVFVRATLTKERKNSGSFEADQSTRVMATALRVYMLWKLHWNSANLLCCDAKMSSLSITVELS